VSVDEFRTIPRANTGGLETKYYNGREYFERKESKTATNRLSYNYNDLHNHTSEPYYNAKPRESAYIPPRKFEPSAGYDKYDNLQRARNFNNYSPLYQHSNYRRYQYSWILFAMFNSIIIRYNCQAEWVYFSDIERYWLQAIYDLHHLVLF